jgi:hypothetical protein
MTQHTTQQPQQAYPADRSPLSRLYDEQIRLHLLYCAGRPSPHLLRQMARVEAAIASGGA